MMVLLLEIKTAKFQFQIEIKPPYLGNCQCTQMLCCVDYFLDFSLDFFQIFGQIFIDFVKIFISFFIDFLKLTTG